MPIGDREPPVGLPYDVEELPRRRRSLRPLLPPIGVGLLLGAALWLAVHVISGAPL